MITPETDWSEEREDRFYIQVNSISKAETTKARMPGVVLRLTMQAGSSCFAVNKLCVCLQPAKQCVSIKPGA